MTVEIACMIDEVLQPRGVAVAVEAEHACMSSRGVHKHGISTTTTKMLGTFKADPMLRNEFLSSFRN